MYNRTSTRAYLASHPFISFSDRLVDAPTALWILLGEAQSKCEHLRDAPLPPTTQRELHQIYLAKGVLGTTAIEGNTLSEGEVRKLLDGTLKLPPSKEYLKTEIDNIVDACNQIWSDDSASVATLTPELIIQFNAAALKGLQLEEGVVPGVIRTYSVGVANYRGAPAEDCQYLLERLCDWLNGPDFQPSPELVVVYAVIRAVIAHLYLAWIHPFGDGNGRTARLAEFYILVQAGVPMAAAHLLSNHYNSTRTEYYRQLSQASRPGGSSVPFITYAVRGFVDGLREQLKLVRETQLALAWSDYVAEHFAGRNSKADNRRQMLVRALAENEWMSRQALTRLTPDIAVAYATKTPKALTRDLNYLADKLKLIEQKDGQVRARRYLMRAFRSKSKDPKVRQEILEALQGKPPKKEKKRRANPAQRKLPLAD